MAGYFNAKLAGPEGVKRDKEIVALVESSLEDMLAHFLPCQRPWFRDRRMWIMVRLGRDVWYWTDYIMRTDKRFFRNMSV